MTPHAEIVPSVVDRIKRSLVGLKMPRAIEILDATVRRIERGEMNALEAIDALLAEELTLRENRRVKMALVMARLSAIKTLAGFDFSFQPSLDRNRIMALAELQFIDRAEALHLIGPPGTGKSHFSLAQPASRWNGLREISCGVSDGLRERRAHPAGLRHWPKPPPGHRDR